MICDDCSKVMYYEYYDTNLTSQFYLINLILILSKFYIHKPKFQTKTPNFIELSIHIKHYISTISCCGIRRMLEHTHYLYFSNALCKLSCFLSFYYYFIFLYLPRCTWPVCIVYTCGCIGCIGYLLCAQKKNKKNRANFEVCIKECF